MTRQEFINLMKSSERNVRLAKVLEDAGILGEFSQLVGANDVFNQGGFRQMFAECNIDLLRAELRDLRSTSGEKLESAILTAKAALATLDNPDASPKLKAAEEKELVKAEKAWKRRRYEAITDFWQGVVVSPGAFYDRAPELLAGVSFPEAIPPHERATGKESVLYLAAVARHAGSEELSGMGPTHIFLLLLMFIRTLEVIPRSISLPLSVVALIVVLGVWRFVSKKVSERENLPAVNAGLRDFLSK